MRATIAKLRRRNIGLGATWVGRAGCLVMAGPAPAAAASIPYTVLYSFAGKTDGLFPNGLVADPEGRLYGVTEEGGGFDQRAVFQLIPPASGSGPWTELVLHSFSGYPGDGSYPNAAVTLGPDGSIYGTTEYGGANSGGTVFKLTNAPGWPITSSMRSVLSATWFRKHSYPLDPAACFTGQHS